MHGVISNSLLLRPLSCILKPLIILQAVFKRKRFQAPLRPFTSGYKLEDYVIGNQIGKGSNAAVYEAAASFAPLKGSKASVVELHEDEEQTGRPLTCCSLRNFPLAIKMMWNFGVGFSLCPISCSLNVKESDHLCAVPMSRMCRSRPARPY